MIYLNDNLIGVFHDATLAEDLAAVDLTTLATAESVVAQRDAERVLADYVNTGNPGAKAHCVMLKSGTQALTLGLRALGVGPGDLVATSPWTFIATCSAITNVGAQPMFVDVDPKRWTMSPEALAKTLADVNVKAVVPVDIFGVPADIDGIAAVCAEHHVPVLVDSCQSLGATVDNVRVGALPGATATAVSLYPTKPLGGHGEGGALFTADTGLCEKVRRLADHGGVQDGDRKQCMFPGDNGRADALLAALQVARMRRADADLAKRRQLLNVYAEELNGKCVFQQIPANVQSAVHECQVAFVKPGLMEKLNEVINVRRLFAFTMNEQPLYADNVNCSTASTIARKSFGLPVFPFIDADELRTTLKKVVNEL